MGYHQQIQGLTVAPSLTPASTPQIRRPTANRHPHWRARTTPDATGRRHTQDDENGHRLAPSLP